MILTEENYYSLDADKESMSVSQFKKFTGTLGKRGCEASAIAEMNGEWSEEKSPALLVGSYVDAWMDGTLEEFKAGNPDLFTKSGELKANYKQADKIIERIGADEYFKAHISGLHQVIMTGEIGGAQWKIKMDSYFPDKLIVDLKVMRSITEAFWVKDSGYMDFVRFWGYDLQGAVYQEIVRQNTGKKLPFRIAAVTKEKSPNIEVIQIEQQLLDTALAEVIAKTPQIKELKEGSYEPIRCEMCDYCRATKKLNRAIWSSDLLGET